MTAVVEHRGLSAATPLRSHDDDSTNLNQLLLLVHSPTRESATLSEQNVTERIPRDEGG